MVLLCVWRRTGEPVIVLTARQLTSTACVFTGKYVLPFLIIAVLQPQSVSQGSLACDMAGTEDLPAHISMHHVMLFCGWHF